MISQKKLKEILYYNPETGEFVWKKRRGGRKLSRAGGVQKSGYHTICIDYKSYQSHQLAWLYVHGYFPENDIDHRDKNPSNNIMSNLREISRPCNIRNSLISKNNSSGVTGVSFDESRNKWAACISVNYKTIHLGRYKDFDEAVCYRLAAEQCISWDECDANSTASEYVKKEINHA